MNGQRHRRGTDLALTHVEQDGSWVVESAVGGGEIAASREKVHG